MTVILDPGNQAESYNATVRAWRTSAGLWKTDYTAQVAATAAKTTTSQTASVSALAGPLTNNGTFFQVATLTAPRSGQGHASGYVRFTFTNDGSCMVRIKRNGSIILSGNLTQGRAGQPADANAQWTGGCSNGDVFTLEAAASGAASSDTDGDLMLTVGST